MSYNIQLIAPEEKDQLFETYEPKLLYTCKIEIYGCCIKLLTDSEATRNEWQDNFYGASENTRSHGRLIVISEPNQPLTVKYDPYTKTAFLINVDYYGWIKSIALAVAGDILEDEHQIYSVHGAAIDVNSQGISIIAPSGTGKTTHSWGLLLTKNARLISDDWYYVRTSNQQPLAFGSEKNCYIEADIGKIWNTYEQLVDKARFDQKGRAIVNVRWIVGPGGVIPMTTLNKIILLKREPQDKQTVKQLNPQEALDFLTQRNFCNPHLLVKDQRKNKIRKNFFQKLFQQTQTYLINTTDTPQATQQQIRKLIKQKNN